jgi:hypothetical protein
MMKLIAVLVTAVLVVSVLVPKSIAAAPEHEGAFYQEGSGVCPDGTIKTICFLGNSFCIPDSPCGQM